MTDLDEETLEKFRKLQMMLAESPEIVEALNSPELLALAAFASSEKNKNHSFSLISVAKSIIFIHVNTNVNHLQ